MFLLKAVTVMFKFHPFYVKISLKVISPVKRRIKVLSVSVQRAGFPFIRSRIESILFSCMNRRIG